MLLTLLLTVRTASAALTVTVDGSPLPGEPFAENGSTYVPLVPLLESLGGWETVWDENARAAVSKTDFFSLSVPAQQSCVLADGFAYDMGAASILRSGRTYVPLRSLANLLGARVEFTDWDSPVAVSSAQNTDYTDNDLYWLSRIISAESQGESLPGQIAVGNVILNRVTDGQFPDTIQAVIFDSRDAVQFEPVSNGAIYDTPTPQSVLAARLALNGTITAGNSLYFFNPTLSGGEWIRENRDFYGSIGCHQFYR